MKADTAAKREYSFARRYRLTKTDEFSSVFGFRRAIRGQLLMLHYLPREEAAADPRLGLVVGKKLLKSAVRRNLVKRVVREQFRLLRSGLPACDLIVRLVAKPGKPDRKAIAAEAAGLFGKLNQRLSRPQGTDKPQ